MGKGDRQRVGQLAFALVLAAAGQFRSSQLAQWHCRRRQSRIWHSVKAMRKSRPSARWSTAETARPFPSLQSLLDGEVQTSGEEIVLVVKGDTAVDAYTGKVVTPIPETLDDVIVNNRMRQELTTAIAALTLSSPDRAVRLAAAKVLQNNSSETVLPAIDAALVKEPDPEVKALLALTKASIDLRGGDKRARSSRRFARSACPTRAPRRRCCCKYSNARAPSMPSRMRRSAPKRSGRWRRSSGSCCWATSRRASFPASRSEPSCCWPRWALRSPMA